MNCHKKSSIILIFLLIHLAFFSQVILSIILKIFPNLKATHNVAFYQMIASCIFFLVPFIIYIFSKKLPLKNILLLKPISFKNILAIILLSITMQPFLSFINILTNTFAKNEIAAPISTLIQVPYWQVILTIAILPAILEELVFRGIFLKEYENCSFWYSIFFSGLFFGLMHLTITQLFYASIAGMIIAYLVKVTGSIWAGILSHFVLNGTQITLAYISNKILQNSTSINLKEEILNSVNSLNSATIFEKFISIFYMGIYFIISLPFLILAIYIFNKINKDNIKKIKEDDIFKKKNNPKIFNIYFVTAIIIYVSYFIFEYIALNIS